MSKNRRSGKNMSSLFRLREMIGQLEIGQTLLIAGIDESILLERKEISPPKKTSYEVYDEFGEIDPSLYNDILKYTIEDAE